MTTTNNKTVTKTRAMFVPYADGDQLQVLGSLATVKATSDDTGNAMEWMLIEAGYGGDVIPHRHPWGEAYYMLEGTLEVQIGARRHEASTGDFLMIPPLAVHSFRVLSEPARFLHVSVGAGATAMFRDLHEVTAEADPDDPGTFVALLEVVARHGVEVVVPELV